MSNQDTTAQTPTDDDIVANTATKQLAAIKEQLRQRDMHRQIQAQVTATLKADGIDLDAINVEEIAKNRLLDLETEDQRRAADARAKQLYFEKYGREFAEE